MPDSVKLCVWAPIALTVVLVDTVIPVVSVDVVAVVVPACSPIYTALFGMPVPAASDDSVTVCA